MERDHLLNKLSRLDLDESEVDLYLAVLELGPCQVREAAERSDVNRTSAYRLLEDLAERGLVETTAEQPMEVSPAPPEHLFDEMRRAKSRELDLIDEIESEIGSTLGEHHDRDERAKPTEDRWRIIRGRERIDEQVTRALGAAKELIWLLCGNPRAWQTPSGNVGGPLAVLRERAGDVDVRALVGPERQDDRRRKELSSIGGVQVRSVAADLGADTHIIDAEVFTGVVEADQPEAATALWSDAPGLYESQRYMFEGLWQAAADED